MRRLRSLNFILLLFIVVFLFFKSTVSYSFTSADTNAVAYFPLQVGNMYAYHFNVNGSSPPSGEIISRITKDTVINNHKYFYLLNFPNTDEGWYRVDSISGSLMRFDTTNTCSYYFKERFRDSLASLPGNQIKNCGLPYSDASFNCTSITNVTVFGRSTQQKEFNYNYSNSPSSFSHKYLICRYFGPLYHQSFYQGPLSQSSRICILKGCIINGIIYGDTTGQFTTLNLVSPSPGHTISTSKYDTSKVVFSWLSTAISPFAVNHWKIRKSSGGSFLWFRSDSSGVASRITFRKSKLDSLAVNFGLNGDSVQCEWCCSVRLSLDSAVCNYSRIITFKTNTVGITTVSQTLPAKYNLANNYPNPFNPTTNINFDIPKNSFVNLKIYDVSGKELTSLVNENLDAGSYNFQWDASSFTSGVYFYRLEASDFVETKRMVLLK